jgi:hypothetical protein
MCQVKVGMTSRSEFDLRFLIFVCSVSRCYGVVALTYGTHEKMGNVCILLGNCRRAGFGNMCVGG